jgi:hypothetical protein
MAHDEDKGIDWFKDDKLYQSDGTSLSPIFVTLPPVVGNAWL